MPVRPLGLDFNNFNKARVLSNECIVSNYRTLNSLSLRMACRVRKNDRQAGVLFLRKQDIGNSTRGSLHAFSLPEFKDLESFFSRLDSTEGHGAECRSCLRSASLPSTYPGQESAYPCD